MKCLRWTLAMILILAMLLGGCYGRDGRSDGLIEEGLDTIEDDMRTDLGKDESETQMKP